MALLGGWLSAANREERAVLRALSDLSDRKMPVRLEVEASGINFFTIVSLRKNALLVARPRSLRGGLEKDSVVRLTLPNHGRKQVRTTVVVPKLKLPMSVRYATICAVPEAFCGVCRRGADRFSTTRFRNLHLQLPEVQKTYRVVDLSSNGLRVFTAEDSSLLLFEPGNVVERALLRVGERARIELEQVVARSQGNQTVGLELRVRRDGTSERFLVNLLNRLAQNELHRLQIDTA